MLFYKFYCHDPFVVTYTNFLGSYFVIIWFKYLIRFMIRCMLLQNTFRQNLSKKFNLSIVFFVENEFYFYL